MYIVVNIIQKACYFYGFITGFLEAMIFRIKMKYFGFGLDDLKTVCEKYNIDYEEINHEYLE